jgi:hypothetical protein
MNFLSRLFGGGGSGSRPDSGLYFYIRPKGCEEVVQVRIDPLRDTSQLDSGEGYFIQKTVRGQHRCFNPAELTLYFDSNRTLTEKNISRGDLVTEEDYHAWQEQLEAKRAAIRAHNAAVDAANTDDNKDG